MNWLHYLLEANLYLAVFYAMYYLFLRNDTHYALNRAYLLTTAVIAFIIPLLQLGFLKPAEPQPLAITLSPLPQTAVNYFTKAPAEAVHFTWQDGLVWVYLIGVALLSVVFVVKIYQLIKLTKGAKSKIDDYKLIYLDDSNTAFSFFNFLFIGTKASGADTIIQHELVHISQRHSADIIFIELLKIMNWFNPFVYLLQASIKTVHEYIADEQTAVNRNDVIAYSTFLVNNAYGLSGSSITHSFFSYNLLKKRIIMLNQKRSGNLARLKYLLVLPIIAGLLCASTLAFSKSYGMFDLLPNKAGSTPQRRYDVWNKSYDHTFTTSKGFKVRERVIFIDGSVSKTAEIFDKAGQKHDYEARFISPKETKYVKDVFGYQFPVDTVIKVKVASPAPAPPTVNQLPAVSAPTVKKLSLAPPTVHVKPTFTSKGYRYEEDGYSINGKTDFRVIIVEKDGSQLAYFKSKAKDADLKLLHDKYGYAFPVMEIYTKLPPPPPAPAGPAIGKRLPPPPPAPPIKTTKLELPLPPIPGFFTVTKKGC